MSLNARIEGNALLQEPAPVLQGRIDAPDHDDRFAELRARIHKACVAQIGPELEKLEHTPDALLDRVHSVVDAELAICEERLTTDDRSKIVRQVVDDVLGYGPVGPLLRDPTVSEVMINGHDQVYVERGGRLEEAGVRFDDADHLMRVIDKIVSAVGRRVDESSPMVDARLADGSRVNVILPPLALNGPTMTIRKFAREIWDADDLVALSTLSAQSAEFLRVCVEGKLNILISGGTGVGKTTLLNALSGFIPDDQRIITIEDAAELQLRQRHVVSLEHRPPNAEGKGEVRIRELVRNALRMRPDRIVVGEVRGAETLDMLQAMNTGHDGSLTTIHSNSPRDALSRLETLVLTAGIELPLRAIREQVASAFDVLIQVTRLVDGSRRVTHITEVLRMESDVISLQDIYVAKPGEGKPGQPLLGPLLATGLRPHFTDKLGAAGVSLAASLLDPAAVAPATASAKAAKS